MFPRIVVATDMSAYANRAEARAAMLAQELGSESLDLLHVVDSLALESLRNLTQPPLDTEQRLMEASRKQMAEIEHKLSGNYGIPITTATVNVGRAHTEIAHYAKLLNAGLIVIGAHGVGFLRELFAGSTVDKVLRTVTCPLLIVKQAPQARYQRILAPVDFSKSSCRATKFAMNIAPHAHITVLHAFEVPFEAKLRSSSVDDKLIQVYETEVQAQKNREMQQLISDLEAPDGSSSGIIEPGSASAVIRKKMEALKPDLIVIGKHGQSERDEMLLGSVTKYVIQDADCDVLVVGMN
ncbi:MAG: universal stress protein [Nitrosospira sp.]|nr:universal stress protein [Nitrosospira sp.]